MNIFKLFHIPKKWQNIVSLFSMIMTPLVLIFFSFLLTLVPIQSLFPASGTPDIPIIILFCLLLHKHARYFVPIFFLCVVLFEYCFMIPAGSLVIHYSIFSIMGYCTWATRLENDVSFRLIYFYFYMTYLFTLIIDIVIYYFMLEGYLGFYDAFLFWISNVIAFPAVFYIAYYLMLQSKPLDRKNNL
jgi:hypothetical protein